MARGTVAMRPATRPAALAAVVVVLAVVAAQAQAPRSQQFARSQKADTSEIARQNHITQQILAQYLQQRLFPQLRTPAAAALAPPRPGWTRPRPPTTAAAAAAAAAARERFRPRERDPPDAPEDEEQDEGAREEEDRERALSQEEEEEQRRREEEGDGQDGGDGEDAASREEFLLRRPPPPPIDIYRVPEGLQPVESEHVANVYLSGQAECTNCVDEGVGLAGNRWTMPLLKLGEKRYYLGIFFKANWYRAAQYCRYHGMHLASINSQEENDKLEKHIRDFGLGNEHFWTSGTDQAEEGTFFWMSTGRPITFENWNAGEPNNFRYENGEEEHCMELWNRDGKGLKWNDSPCSFETFFVCEVQ